MRIAFLQRQMSYEHGGEERSLLSLTKSLSTLGIKCEIWYEKLGTMHGELSESGVELIQHPISEFQNWSFPVNVIKGVCRVLNKPNIIHVNSYKDVTYASVISTILNIPLSLHLRLNAPEYFSKQYTLAFNRVRLALANSEFVKNDWEKFVEGRFPVKVIYNGLISKEIGQLCDIVNQKSLKDDKTIKIGFIGRILEEKGVSVFINAIKELTNDSLEVKGILLGGDGLKNENVKAKNDYLEELTRDGIAHLFEFQGHVKNISHYLSSIDILVIPSLFDSFGRTYMEALFSGIPTLISNRGGTTRFVKCYPGLGKYLFNPDDINELKMKLIDLIKGNLLYPSDSARQIAADNFDMSNAAKKTLAEFKTLI